MSVCRECYVLSGRYLCDELISRPDEFYRLWCVVVCDLENSWMRRPWPIGGCRAKNKDANKVFRTEHGKSVSWTPPILSRIQFLTKCNFECHQHLSAQEPGNLVVSPVSIKLVLAMLYEGAAGNTASELERVLRLPSRLQTRKRFSAILNSLLVSNPVPSASISLTNHRSSSDQQRPTSFNSRSLKHSS